MASPAPREILVVFSDEWRAEVQRRTAEGWRVDDLIGQAELRLGCCASAIRSMRPTATCSRTPR